MFVIVGYDIVMDKEGQKILKQVFKTCKRYLFRLQNSFFVGELTTLLIEELEQKLKFFLRSKDKCDIMVIKNIKNVQQHNLTNPHSYNKINIIE